MVRVYCRDIARCVTTLYSFVFEFILNNRTPRENLRERVDAVGNLPDLLEENPPNRIRRNPGAGYWPVGFGFLERHKFNISTHPQPLHFNVVYIVCRPF